MATAIGILASNMRGAQMGIRYLSLLSVMSELNPLIKRMIKPIEASSEIAKRKFNRVK